VASTCASDARRRAGRTGTPALLASGLGVVGPRSTASGPGCARLCAVDLRLEPGEGLALVGASGSGKSTLLRALAGLSDARRETVEGRVTCRGGAGLLLQDVESQLLWTTAEEEVVFALRNRGVPAPERSQRAARALADVGLAGLGARPVERLSVGQQQRVALAALLALRPGVLLLDEPASQLDPPAVDRLRALLRGLKAGGTALVIADHVPQTWEGLVERSAALKEGRLDAQAGWPLPRRLLLRAPKPAPPAAEVWLEARDLAVSSPEAGVVLAGASLRLRAGERVHLGGANGAGKSTLLRALAGLLPLERGVVRAAGRRLRGPGDAAGAVSLLPQTPWRTLFEARVCDEVAFTPRRLGWSARAVRQRTREVLGRCGASHLAERSPLALSVGEQHRVALAVALAPRPRVLLLDEPFAGLGPESAWQGLEALAAEQAETGAAVVVASHARLPAEGWCHRAVWLEAGRLRRA